MEQAKEYLLQQLQQTKNEKLATAQKHLFRSKTDLKKYVMQFLDLSYDEIRDRRLIDLWLFEHKYRVHRPRKLGNQNRMMPEGIYQALMPYIHERFPDRVYLALEFEGFEGARGEDTVRIKLSDLDFKEHQVRVVNRKAGGRLYEVPLNHKLELDLKKFITTHIKEIHEHDDFIFFSNNRIQKRKHLSERYLKDVVRVSLKDLNLYKVYGKSDDGRDLGLYCLHGFREHAGNRVYEKSNFNIEKVRELLDHVSSRESELYVDRIPEKDLQGLV